jgi:mono/diheme cytochrome c family protein
VGAVLLLLVPIFFAVQVKPSALRVVQFLLSKKLPAARGTFHFFKKNKHHNMLIFNKNLLVALACVSAAPLGAQVNWSQDIAPILYQHCASCHRDGGLGGFSLVGYSSAFSNRYAIAEAVSTRQMPPWKADPTYRHYAGENLLTQTQIDQINAWVNADGPAGDFALAPAEPVFIDGSAIGIPDATTQTPTYTMTGTEDEYRCFVVPSGVTTDQFLRGMEVIPGNHMAVHHVLIYQDVTGQAAALDAQTPEPGYLSFGGPGVDGATLVGAWVPGTRQSLLPPFMGVRLKANADLVVQVHFPGAATGLSDQSTINMFFTPTNVGIREVRLTPILNHTLSLVNGPLVIPANTTRTFEAQFTLPGNASIISVAPHMHLIARSVECFSIEPTGDTIPLVRIPDWDFHWQGPYTFQHVQKISNGSKLKAFAHYDNTTANPHNPSNPPQLVTLGEATTDEMMLVYFAYMTYQPGDENILLDSTLLATGAADVPDAVASLRVVPNPAGDAPVAVEFFLKEKADVTLTLADATGRTLRQMPPLGTLAAGRHSVSLSLADCPSGRYFVQLRSATGEVKVVPVVRL